MIFNIGKRTPYTLFSLPHAIVCDYNGHSFLNNILDIQVQNSWNFSLKITNESRTWAFVKKMFLLATFGWSCPQIVFRDIFSRSLRNQNSLTLAAEVVWNFCGISWSIAEISYSKNKYFISLLRVHRKYGTELIHHNFEMTNYEISSWKWNMGDKHFS